MTSEELLRIFETRRHRFKFLDNGIDLIAPNKGERWLEVGCNNGDATSHIVEKYSLDSIGIDLNPNNIDTAKKRYNENSFICCDATATTFEDNFFNGIFSEAAFSPIESKESLAKEYRRILKPGGYVLINDFSLKEMVDSDERYEYSHIPCFAGVGFPKEYAAYFEDFELVHCQEDYSELLAIVMHLSKKTGVKPMEIGALLSRYYNLGREKASCPFGESRGMMARAKLTYTRIILRKI